MHLLRAPILRHATRGFAAFVGPRQAAIEQRLEQVFSPLHMEVVNESHGRKEDESHFKVVVISEQFADKRLLMRHRLVNEALLDANGVLPFHSLSIAAAKTPAEWSKDASIPPSPKCAGGDGRGMKM
jgi:stress-induced morphogen